MATGTLTSTTPAATYKSLLKVQGTNQVLDGTLRVLEDGDGNDSALKLAITGTAIGATLVGKLGIGTDSPDATLHVKDAEVAGTVVIESSSTNTDNTAPEVKLLRSNTTNLSVDDDLGQIRFQAYDNAGTPAVFNYSGIMTYISNYTDGSEEGALQFQVAQGGTGAGGGTAVMTLKGSKVGIGTTSPDSLLEIENSSTDEKPVLSITNTSTTAAHDGGELKFIREDPSAHLVTDALSIGDIKFVGKDASGTAITGALIRGFVDGTDATTNDLPCGLKFFTNAGSTGVVTTARMLIDKSGNVGLGLSPTANMEGLSIESGCITLKERATPTADANYGKIYTKNDNKIYFQDGAGTEHEISFA